MRGESEHSLEHAPEGAPFGTPHGGKEWGESRLLPPSPPCSLRICRPRLAAFPSWPLGELLSYSYRFFSPATLDCVGC